MICENIVTEGTVKDINRVNLLTRNKEGNSITVETEHGLITIPVRDAEAFKFNQKLYVTVQVSSHEPQL